MLNIDPHENRSPKSFTLKPSTVTTIEALAMAYKTNASRIIEAMVTQYGPKILAQLKQEKEEK